MRNLSLGEFKRSPLAQFAGAFVVLGLGRRDIVWIGVTTNPTAQWLAREIAEAFPWDAAPKYLIRDNDGADGEVFTRRLYAMGIWVTLGGDSEAPYR